ncbi:MAG: hypothetical protein GX383_03370 [Clostridium sp.]|nr:hypothetical protein [Clostridium sp.]
MSLGKLVSIEILTKKPSASIGGGSSRPLFACKWIEQNMSMPPMEFSLMVENIYLF